MATFLIAFSVFFGLFRELWRLFKDPKYRSLLIWAALLLLVGTIFFNQVEGWGVLNSLYFSVVTLSSVGYGDFTPQTPAGKLFAIVYMLFGLSILASFVSMLARERQFIHDQRFGDADAENEETSGRHSTGPSR